MTRWTALTATAVALVGTAIVTGAANPTNPAKPLPEAKAEPAGARTGYFNMARVMRESKRAKAGAEKLNAKRARATVNLQVMRQTYADLQAKLMSAGQGEKERLADEALKLARKIEDADREVQKTLNERAQTVIGTIHDELKAAVAALAKEKGLGAVLAYPDAVTPEEANNPMIKELRLKPPAAQPFYIDPELELTEELVKRLNEKFEADEDN